MEIEITFTEADLLLKALYSFIADPKNSKHKQDAEIIRQKLSDLWDTKEGLERLHTEVCNILHIEAEQADNDLPL